MRRKGFVYIRSTDMYQTEEIRLQMDEITEACHECGIRDIVFFIDYGAGGNLRYNVEYARLKETISHTAKNQAVFVVRSMDRLTEDICEWREVLANMQQMGAICCSVKSGYFSDDVGPQQELDEIVDSMYLDEGDEKSLPKLLILQPSKADRNAILMSNGNECYLIRGREIGMKGRVQ